MINNDGYGWSDYSQSLIDSTLPWIAFGCFAFVVLILAIVIRCLKYMCCKQKIKEKAETIKNICVGVSLIVTLLAVGCCCFIIYFSDATYQSYLQLECASGRIPYALTNGAGSPWMGLVPAKNSISNSSATFDSSYESDTFTLWENSGWLDSADKNFNNSISNYEQYSETNVSSPNPNNHNLVPTSFTQQLGPSNDTGSYSGKIVTEYYLRIGSILSNITLLKNETNGLSPSSVTSQLDEVSSQLSIYNQGISSIQSDVENWLINNENNVQIYWKWFGLGIVAWGWFITFGALITITAQALHKPRLANGLCCFWLSAGIVAVLGFAATTATLAVGIVTNNICDLSNDLFTTEGLKEYNYIIPEKSVDYLNLCLNQDGDLYSFLNIADGVSSIVDINTTYTKILDSSISYKLSQFDSIAINQEQIQISLNYFDALPYGIDYQDSPICNLDILNNYTYNPTYQFEYCLNNYTLDLWVFNQSSCGSVPYISNSNSTARLGESSCLVLSEWNSSGVNERYNGIYSGCDYLSDIYLYQGSLYSFSTDIFELFQEINTALSYVQSNISQTVNQLVVLNSQVNEYFNTSSPIGGFINDIINPSGLSSTLDCSFVKSYTETLQNAICSNTINSMYEVFIYIFILSFLMLVLEFTNLYLSRALLKPEDY